MFDQYHEREGIKGNKPQTRVSPVKFDLLWAASGQGMTVYRLLCPMLVNRFTLSCGILSLSALAACSADNEKDGEQSTNKVAVSLALTAPNLNLPLGLTEQVSAIVTYDDGTTGDVTESVTWISSNSDVAVVSTQSEVAGLVITGDVGSTRIGAQLGNLIEYVNFEVAEPAVTGLTIESSKGDTLGIGQSVQLRALATRTDDTRTDISKDVSWSTSDNAVALIDNQTNKGFMTTRDKTGQVSITASLGEITASNDFTITDSVLVSLELTANPRRIEVGSQTIVSARGTYTDGSTRNMSSLVTWSSADQAVATISDSGVVTGIDRGDNVEITATSDNGIMASTTVSVFVPGDCNYPEPHTSIANGRTMPKIEWEDALLVTAGSTEPNQVYFSMEQFACAEQYQQYTSILFVVSTGWCPYCPDYNRQVSNQAEELAAAGMLVAFAEAETSSRQPPTSQQAFDIVANWGVDGPGLRLGDGATKPIEFAIKQWASAYPSAFVVRRSDMKVLNENPRGMNLLNLAQNIESF